MSQKQPLGNGLITLTNPRSPISEAYRTLRTNLQFASLDKPLRTLMITSAGPDDGKSTVLANLAVAMAQAEKTVIAVDCDLRKPALHTLFGLDRAQGLTTMVLDTDAVTSPPLQQTSVPGLQLLAAGGPVPPSPSDLFTSRRMESILGTLKERAEIVLLDAPPVLVVSDALILASKVDAVLLVICAGQTRREDVQAAKLRLERVNANLLGAVLTNASVDTDMSYYSTEEESK